MSDVESTTAGCQLPRDELGLATSAEAMPRLEARLSAFLRDAVDRADADGCIVTLDGSLESAVTATLAVEALGEDAVTGLITPAQLTDEAPARDAEALASVLGVDCRRLQLQPLLIEFQKVVGTAGEPTDDLLAMENAVERFRTACRYYLANTTNCLVVGALTRTDHLLGHVAKHGEDAVDLALLVDLYRTEVSALADHLDVPGALVSDGQRRTRHTGPADATELDVETETLDAVLRRVIDAGNDPATVGAHLDVRTDLVERVRSWHDSTVHKRRRPPSPLQGD